jgi:cellulose synthase operon protein YhjQ
MLTAHLARELVRAGSQVIALDLDPQNALAMQFGVDLADAFGFFATLRYASDPRAAWRAALRSSPSGVSFLPYGQVGLEGANAASQAMLERPEMLTQALRDMLGMSGVTILVDLPAGPSPAMSAVLPYADLMLVPLLPDPSCVAQMRMVDGGRFAGGAKGFDPSRMAFVLNRCDSPGHFTPLLADAMRQHLGHRILGSVCHDDRVVEAMLARGLLAPVASGAETVSHSAAGDIAELAVSVQQRLNAQHPLTIHAMAALAELSPLSRHHVAQEVTR